jgi:hypothetical protein
VHWINASLPCHPLAQLDSTSSAYGQSPVHYSISFPEVRWESIRNTEGWAGLQHHALLHTTIRLSLPWPRDGFTGPQMAHLLLFASQCSYIAIFDSGYGNSVIPRWHACDIYSFTDAPTIRIPFNFGRRSVPGSSDRSIASELLGPIGDSEAWSIELDVLISLDYEIRLFGDPTVSTNQTTPIIQTELWAKVEVENLASSGEPSADTPAGKGLGKSDQLALLNHGPTQSYPCFQVNDSDANIFPHFISGWAYGDAVGIEVTSCSQEVWTISHAVVFSHGNSDHVSCLEALSPQLISKAESCLL